LGSSGWPFYRRPGQGRGREVACTGELTTAGMVAHSGDNETARAGEGRRDGSAGARDRAARRQVSLGRRNGEATGRWRSAAIASLALVMGARKALTGGACLPRRERSRRRGALADGWGRGVSGGAGARQRAALAAGGRGGGRTREGEGGALGQKRPSRGGRFSFLFLFLISIFYFYFFYLLFF
jgi:hypothetical protein